MKITIAELKALAKRAGVGMYRRHVTGAYRIKWPWEKFGIDYNLNYLVVRSEVKATLTGIIAKREGLLP